MDIRDEVVTIGRVKAINLENVVLWIAGDYFRYWSYFNAETDPKLKTFYQGKLEALEELLRQLGMDVDQAFKDAKKLNPDIFEGLTNLFLKAPSCEFRIKDQCTHDERPQDMECYKQNCPIRNTVFWVADNKKRK